MATSDVKVSPNDFNCTQGNCNSVENARTSNVGLIKNSGLLIHELNRAESCKPGLKPEWLQSKDATKRKRVNRTAKLKQCKLDARREQWLSQGSHSRANYVVEDCHETLVSKGNDSSLAVLREHHPPSETERPSIIQTPNFEQVMNSAGYRGKGLSRSNITNWHADKGKQAIPVKWKDKGLLQLSELDFAKNSVTNEVVRPTVDRGNDNTGATVDQRFLTDRSDSTVPIKSRSNITNIAKETGLFLAGDMFCRRDVPGRDGEEMLVDNALKQGQGSEHLPHSLSHLSTIQLSKACTSSRYGGGSDDDDGLFNPHDGDEDWETVADAIYLQGSSPKTEDVHEFRSAGTADLLEREEKISATMKLQAGALQPEYKYKASSLGRTRVSGGRAWRPDDAARPLTLPRLSKQHSFPHLSCPPTWSELNDTNLWGPPPAPLFCPICTEELDLTDSSFVPCSCGFRLCLFCHHRIAADDGRCPGCRKAYKSDAAMKLSRSSSMWLQI